MDFARSYAQEARDALDEEPDSSIRAILDDLALYTVERES